MGWRAPAEKPVASPEQFDWHYSNPSRPPELHGADLLELSGPLRGLRVLDLGGGDLLARLGVTRECCYHLVDFSATALMLAQQSDPNLHPHQEDVRAHLEHTVGRERFDLVLCCGILEYLPAEFLDLLLRLAPAPVLCLCCSTAQAYLQYPGRIYIPSDEELLTQIAAHGWQVTRRLERPSHFWARLERTP